jgi:hypothetical protein
VTASGDPRLLGDEFEKFIDMTQQNIKKMRFNRLLFEFVTDSYKGYELRISNADGTDFIEGMISLTWHDRVIRAPEEDDLWSNIMELVA